jgi:hypothetical protein
MSKPTYDADELIDELEGYKKQGTDLINTSKSNGIITGENSASKNIQSPNAPMSNEEAEGYIRTRAATLMDKTFDAIDRAYEMMQLQQDSESTMALSQLIHSASSIMDKLTRLVMQHKRDKNLMQMKIAELEVRKSEIAAGSSSNNNEQAVTLTRTEILSLLQQGNTPKAADEPIDVT